MDTITDEVSGDADEWEMEVACATNFSVQSNYRVDLNPAFVQTILDGDDEDLEVIGVFNIGGIQATLPLLLKTAGLVIDASKAQMENVSLSNRGAPSGVAGNTVLMSALVGTAAFAYNVRTTPGASGASFAGNCLVKSSRVSFDNAAIIAASHNFVNTGQPTVTRAA